jgi:hypothetical protein
MERSPGEAAFVPNKARTLLERVVAGLASPSPSPESSEAIG